MTVENTNYIELLIVLVCLIAIHVFLNKEVFIVEDNRISTTISLPIVLPAVIFVEPFIAGMYAALFDFILLYRRRKEWLKFVYNVCTHGLVVLLLALLAQRVFMITEHPLTSPAFLAFSFLLGLLYTGLINGLPIGAIILQSGKTDMQLIGSFISAIRTSLITIFLGIINVFIYYYFGLVGIAISTFLMYFIKPVINFRSILDNELSTFTNFILHIIKLYDPTTYAHSERVKKWTVMIAKEMKLPSKEIHELSQAASWHDIGKIEIPADIINKKGTLTAQEYEIVKQHPEIGYQIVKDMHFFKDYLPVIRYHHERMDGKGYPLGLIGTEIPLHARIMCVADSFDAMTSKRSYKKGMTMKQAVEELRRCAGSQFDPEIVEIFIRALQKTYGSDFQKWDKQVANF
jgi:HD-GYP domain-containing protein (c-di-GMP phosphodiesterase class II)